ncbi:MAG: hypothetical protein ACYDG5_07790 [Dehalococcoidales bacterium]
MITKRPTKKMEFDAQDESFIQQLAKDIGCHYCKANERTYSLNKFASAVHGEMGVFGWVHKEDTDYFWVATRKIWVEAARAKALSGRKKSTVSCFSRDTQHADDSVSYDTKNDYQKAVSSLKLINKMR